MTYLMHHGIKGQRWGVRRYQNEDGTYTEEGKERHYKRGEHGSFMGQTRDSDIKIKAGTKAYRLQKSSELGKDGQAYISFLKDDTYLYSKCTAANEGGLAIDLFDGNGANILTLKLTEDLIMPSYTKTMDAFISTVQDVGVDKIAETIGDRVAAKYAMDGTDLVHALSNLTVTELRDKAYKAFATTLMDDSEARTTFIGTLERMGYNAVVDENDKRFGDGFTESPTIVFKKENSLSQESVLKINTKDAEYLYDATQFDRADIIDEPSRLDNRYDYSTIKKWDEFLGKHSSEYSKAVIKSEKKRNYPSKSLKEIEKKLYESEEHEIAITREAREYLKNHPNSTKRLYEVVAMLENSASHSDDNFHKYLSGGYYMSTYYYGASCSPYLSHHGIKGMRWGIRRYQNADGSLTEAGLKRRQKLEYKIETTKAKASIAKNKADSSKSKYDSANYKKQKYDLKKKEKEDKKAAKKAEKEAKENASAKKVKDFFQSENGKKLLSAGLAYAATRYIGSKTDESSSDILYAISKAFAPNAKNQTQKQEEAQEKATKKRNDEAKGNADYAKSKWQAAKYTNDYHGERDKAVAYEESKKKTDSNTWGAQFKTDNTSKVNSAMKEPTYSPKKENTTYSTTTWANSGINTSADNILRTSVSSLPNLPKTFTWDI